MRLLIAALALGLTLLPFGEALAHGMSEADKQSMLDGSYLDYVWLGASHMVTGYDHLLFLFGVIFFLTGFKDVVKFVTVFTIGHSITLIFATFMGITANYFVIDAVIALSVIYKGFDNLGGFKKHFNIESPNLLAMVFAFGLIHGFGLSTRLQQIPLGDDNLHILIRIISFNVGVELGQIAALAVMVAVLSFWRRTGSFQRFATLSNAALVAGGLFLFFLQSHGAFHAIHGEDLHFATKNHQHAHEDMAIEADLEQRRMESARDNL